MINKNSESVKLNSSFDDSRLDSYLSCEDDKNELEELKFENHYDSLFPVPPPFTNSDKELTEEELEHKENYSNLEII